MGRWLARLQHEEKNEKTPKDRTDKTDKTAADPLLSVLSVPHPSKSANFSGGRDQQAARAKRRLADKYDAAQERGELAGPSDGKLGRSGGERPTTAADLGLSRKDVHEARIIRDPPAKLDNLSTFDLPPPPVVHPVGWLPEPSPGVTILRPGVGLPTAEYDARINAMLAKLPVGSPEAKRLDFARRKGWVIDCDGERIFTRGRF